ncbi:MAG: outer membrane beta-barrel protein [Campylobacterota bacterium]|nr:outer membrane beta-barrel protein [Campylobacterota bacterium]
MKVVLLFLMFMGVVYADRDGGPYVGVGYGVSQYNSDGLYENLKRDTSNSTTIYAGAYINKYFSVELGQVNFTSWEVDDSSSVSYSALSVSTLVHYAFFDDILDFYAKFGVGQIDASGIDSGGFTFVYGGGVGVRFNEWFSMKVAYDRYAFEYQDAISGNYNMNIDNLYSALEFQF